MEMFVLPKEASNLSGISKQSTLLSNSDLGSGTFVGNRLYQVGPLMVGFKRTEIGTLDTFSFDGNTGEINEIEGFKDQGVHLDPGASVSMIPSDNEVFQCD